LRFCLADGTSLVPAFAERVTRQDEAATVRMETPVRPTSSYDPPPKAPRAFKIILGLLAVVVFFGAIAMVGLLIFINKNRVRSVSTPTPPTPAATSTPGGENDRLGRELANAKKQLGETNGRQPGDVPEPPKPPAPAANARANSPKDGFLALRELPSTDIGELVVKIPHERRVHARRVRADKDQGGHPRRPLVHGHLQRERRMGVRRVGGQGRPVDGTDIL
jgi:hypothetical protein